MVCNISIVVTFFYCKFRNAEDIEEYEHEEESSRVKDQVISLDPGDTLAPTMTFTEISSYPSTHTSIF